MLGSSYGLTPTQICDEIEQRGAKWLDACIRNIILEKTDYKRWMLAVAPLGRTPQDKKGSRALNRYARKLHEILDQQIPWAGRKKRNRLLRGAEEAKKRMGM